MNIFRRARMLEKNIGDVHRSLLSEIYQLKHDNLQLRRIIENSGRYGEITYSYKNTTDSSFKDIIRTCDLFIYRYGKEYKFNDFKFPKYFIISSLKLEFDYKDSSNNVIFMDVIYNKQKLCRYCLDLKNLTYALAQCTCFNMDD